MPSSRPTIRDVARLAGVSHQTVSRVINGSDEVTSTTRARVEAVIADLNYRPSAVARSMARGRSGILACIAPNLTDYTFARIIEGSEREARQRGFFLLSSSAEGVEDFRALCDELVGHRRVDGLVVMNPYADERHAHLPANFPVVFVGAHSRDDAISSVSLNDEKAAYDATRYILSLGRRKIAMVTGPMSEDCSQDRSDGYMRALAESGVKVDYSLIIEGDWSATSGQDALLALCEQGCQPDAVFAQNDRMALGVLHAARDMGIRVPRELAVIGVDDMPLSSYFDPPLTTMHQDMARIGQEAIRMLAGLVENVPGTMRHIKIPAQLVVRQSTIEEGGD